MRRRSCSLEPRGSVGPMSGGRASMLLGDLGGWRPSSTYCTRAAISRRIRTHAPCSSVVVAGGGGGGLLAAVGGDVLLASLLITGGGGGGSANSVLFLLSSSSGGGWWRGKRTVGAASRGR